MPVHDRTPSLSKPRNTPEHSVLYAGASCSSHRSKLHATPEQTVRYDVASVFLKTYSVSSLYRAL